MLEMFLLLNEKQRNKCEYIRVSFIFLGLSTCSMGRCQDFTCPAWSCFWILFTQPHHSLFRSRVCWSERLWQTDFQSTEGGREREFRVTGGAKMRASRVKANVKDSQCQVCVRTLVRVRFVCKCVWLPYSHNRPVVNLKTLKSSCFLLHLLLLTPYFLASYFSLALRHYAWQRSEKQMEVFRNAGVPPKQKVTAFKVSDSAIIKPGMKWHWILQRKITY